MSIEVRNISKSFGQFQALKNIHLTVPGGELVAMLGPSGCGKTTLLRIIAGLESPDEGGGAVLFNGSDVSDVGAGRRGVGFVFQHYALFKHMSIFENVAFGMRVRPRSERPSRKEIRDRVMELLSLVQLDHLAARFPHQLSGGQRQRVAMARALAVRPQVLLLDEPFGALDARIRQELRRWLRRLHDELHITGLIVTHDQEDALEVADRVVVMNEGRIEQEGTPEEIYDRPATPFVYQFMGHVNLFHARVERGLAAIDNVVLDTPAPDGAEDGQVLAFVRPHDVEIVRQSGDQALVDVVIRSVRAVGPRVRVELERPGGRMIEAEMSKGEFAQYGFLPGERVHLRLRNLRVFSEPADARDARPM